MVIQSNSLDQPQQVVAEPLTGPAYRIVNRGPWVPAETEEKPKENRSKETYDERADMARWVVDNCQGIGLNAAGEKLAAEFGKSASTCREQLMRGSVSALLTRKGKDRTTTWSLK
jgi:hypothetical protein